MCKELILEGPGKRVSACRRKGVSASGHACLSEGAVSGNRTIARSAKSESVMELSPREPVGITAKRFKDSARGFNPGNASNQASRPEGRKVKFVTTSEYGSVRAYDSILGYRLRARQRRHSP
jgi:hypothetical protein